MAFQSLDMVLETPVARQESPRSNTTKELTPQLPAIPVPAAYGRKLTYIPPAYHAQYRHHDRYIQEYEKTQNQRQLSEETWYSDSKPSSDGKKSPTSVFSQSSFSVSGSEEPAVNTAKKDRFFKLGLITITLITRSRIWVRVAAIIIALTSLSLVITAIATYNNARNIPNMPFSPPGHPITVHPCVIFSGVSAMNIAISISVLIFSFKSGCLSLSNNVIHAIFTINSAVAFGSSMGVCFFLGAESALQNDLWAYSCNAVQSGDPNADFNLSYPTICAIISSAWTLSLVQASLELFIFVVSIIAFLGLKWRIFVNHGRIF